MSKLFVSPISVEKFAAFLDDNLPPSEMEQISSIVETIPQLNDIYCQSSIIDRDIIGVEQGSNEVENFTDFQLPDVSESNNMLGHDMADDFMLIFEPEDNDGISDGLDENLDEQAIICSDKLDEIDNASAINDISEI